MTNEYIHFGATSLCEIIKNEHCFTKPHGGLWASPINAKFGWKDWCLRENFCTGKLERSFIFKLKPNAKIIHIYSIDDLESLPKLQQEIPSWTTLDFEKLADEYDGIELHLSEEKPPKKKKTGRWNCLYFELYGWQGLHHSIRKGIATMILICIKENEIEDYKDVADYIYYDNAQKSFVAVQV